MCRSRSPAGARQPGHDVDRLRIVEGVEQLRDGVAQKWVQPLDLPRRRTPA